MIQDLMKELEMDEASTRNALLFWQKRGLLSRSQKDENLYELQQGDKKRNGTYFVLKITRVLTN